MALKTERLNLRLSGEQETLLRRAAEVRGEAVSEYVLRHAVDAAVADLADRRLFVVDEDAWAELEAALTRPAPALPERLARLLREPSVLERS